MMNSTMISYVNSLRLGRGKSPATVTPAGPGVMGPGSNSN